LGGEQTQHWVNTRPNTFWVKLTEKTFLECIMYTLMKDEKPEA